MSALVPGWRSLRRWPASGSGSPLPVHQSWESMSPEWSRCIPRETRQPTPPQGTFSCRSPSTRPVADDDTVMWWVVAHEEEEALEATRVAERGERVLDLYPLSG